jgi:hypothetical protein
MLFPLLLFALASVSAWAYPSYYQVTYVTPDGDGTYDVAVYAYAFEDPSYCCENFNQASVTNDHDLMLSLPQTGRTEPDHEINQYSGLQATSTVTMALVPAATEFTIWIYFRFHIPGYDGWDAGEYLYDVVYGWTP